MLALLPCRLRFFRCAGPVWPVVWNVMSPFFMPVRGYLAARPQSPSIENERGRLQSQTGRRGKRENRQGSAKEGTTMGAEQLNANRGRYPTPQASWTNLRP